MDNNVNEKGYFDQGEKRGSRLMAQASRSQPILDRQSGDPFEFFHIIGHHDGADGPGMGRDHHVHGADDSALPLQIHTDQPILECRRFVERQDFERRNLNVA
jgi:hypothetical protein